MEKTMRKWRLVGTVTMTVEVSVVADTLEEAIELADGDVSIEEYCGAQAGVDCGYSDEVDDPDFTYDGCGIEWDETYSELEEVWTEDVEDDEDEDEDEDDDDDDEEVE